MGGGDLNSKKSWHPNTMKNQERVWKAEQAAAEEKQRIMELQNERAAERDRAELNSLAKRNAAGLGTGDDRLHWMYDKPDKKAQDEDYLLGRSIEKNYDQPEKSEDIIPAVARRVVGSSMSATAVGDTQVDLARKIREDPLLLVKERERAARAALLNNPLHRKRLTDLLRKEQEQKGKTKKKLKKKNHDLDDKLAAKLNALGGEKSVNLAALLASDDSSSSSDSEEEQTSKKKKKKKHEKKKAKKSKKNKCKDTETDLSDDDKRKRHKIKDEDRQYVEKKKSKKSKHTKNTDSEGDKRENYREKSRSQGGHSPDSQRKLHKIESRKRRSDSYDSDEEAKHKRNRREKEKRDTHEEPKRGYKASRQGADSGERRGGRSPEYSNARSSGGGVSAEERAARLAAMAAEGAAREESRARRVAAQRAAAQRAPPAPAAAARPEARALPLSLESRIHSNRHYIQRNSSHMNEHFARR